MDRNVAEKGIEAQSGTREGSKLRCARPWPFRVSDVSSEVRRQGPAFRPLHVQVSIQREAICGRLVECQANGHGWDRFRIDTKLGIGWYGSRHVRRCSGVDGRCICAGEGGEPGRQDRPAPASALSPLGNTGTTTVEGA